MNWILFHIELFYIFGVVLVMVDAAHIKLPWRTKLITALSWPIVVFTDLIQDVKRAWKNWL